MLQCLDFDQVETKSGNDHTVVEGTWDVKHFTLDIFLKAAVNSSRKVEMTC